MSVRVLLRLAADGTKLGVAVVPRPSAGEIVELAGEGWAVAFVVHHAGGREADGLRIAATVVVRRVSAETDEGIALAWSLGS